MIGLASSFPSSSFEDPVFLRTHFLGKVASEDLGLDQPSYKWKRSARRHDDMKRWDAKWFITVSHDDASSDESDISVSEDTTHASSTANWLNNRSDRAKSMSHLDSSWPTPIDPDTKKRVRARHDRSASAPQPLRPAQPLTINTSQPLRLSSPSVESLRSLAGSGNMNDLRVQTSSSEAPLRINSSDAAASSLVIECSESDGSCHGDAGDYDPEGQLAAEIIRLRNAKRASAQEEKTLGLVSSPLDEMHTTSAPTTVQEAKRATQIHTSTYDYCPEDDFVSDEDHSMAINHNRGGLIIRIAEAALDMGMNSIEYFTGTGSAERDNKSDSNVSTDRQLAIRRVSTTPIALREEARQMIRRRQSSASARSRRNDPIAGYTIDSDVSRPSLGGRAQSFISMPSLLSRSNSLWSLASSAIPSLPVSRHHSCEDIHKNVDMIDGQTTYRSFGVQHRKDSGYGLSSYSDEPSAFMDPTTTGATTLPSSHLIAWWAQAAPDMRHLRMTEIDPKGNAPVSAVTEQVSPLWREEESVDEANSQSLWETLFMY